MSKTTSKGHTREGDWIFVPLDYLTTPKTGLSFTPAICRARSSCIRTPRTRT